MANDPVRTIVVVGATGNQGRGVVRAILEDPLLSSYYVRALTRDVHSHAAMNLLNSLQTPSTRLSLATADVFNVKSLELAFEGAYGVFAVTTMWKAGTRCETEDDLKGELESGENIVAAAKHAGVKHFVFSSLPNINKASNGRFRKLFHFDHKAAIQELAMQELPATTALHAGYFYSNLNWEWVCKRKDDGTVRFCAPVDSEVWSDWLDPEYDIGVFTAAIFAKGPELTHGKTYPVSSRMLYADFPRIYTEVTSQPAIHEPISLDEWRRIQSAGAGPGFAEDATQMMEWTAVAPTDKILFGTMDPKEDYSWEDLGVRATSFPEWIKRNNWTAPA